MFRWFVVGGLFTKKTKRKPDQTYKDVRFALVFALKKTSSLGLLTFVRLVVLHWCPFYLSSPLKK